MARQVRPATEATCDIRHVERVGLGVVLNPDVGEGANQHHATDDDSVAGGHLHAGDGDVAAVEGVESFEQAVCVLGAGVGVLASASAVQRDEDERRVHIVPEHSGDAPAQGRLPAVAVKILRSVEQFRLGVCGKDGCRDGERADRRRQKMPAEEERHVLPIIP